MTVPSVGDVLMQSQVAWKIGRAFSAGRKNAPPDFQAIEIEISGLAKALKLLAEALYLHAEEGLIETAGKDIQDGIATIISSSQRTVNDLDSLVDQYQVIKKHRTVDGFAIERSWSDLVLAEYGTMIWTTEGGTIKNLKNLIQIHASSAALLTQALQSKSLANLESVIDPMAIGIDSFKHSPQSFDQQLEEVFLLQSLAFNKPCGPTPPLPERHLARSPTIETNFALSPSRSPLQGQITRVTSNRSPQHSLPPERPLSLDISIRTAAPYSPTETVSSSRASSPTQKRVSEFSFGVSSIRYSSRSYASSDAGTSSNGWPSPGPSKESISGQHHMILSKKISSLPHIPEVCESSHRVDGRHLSLLPPSALGLATPYGLERVPSHTSHASHVKLSPYPSTQPDTMNLHRSSTTASQRTAFEKEAFRNSAILCDVRGKLVEYSHRINEDDPKDIEMIEASEDCRIAVVRKRVTDPETRAVRVITSVWAFSDDNTIRVELRMADDQMYIPYSSYFSLSKVSITVPCELKFHDVKHGNRPARLAKTSWVNYVFDTPQAAALFQNELMGRTLLATFRTEKTMRTHEGIGKSFSYAEQMCGLETLRIWEDNDTGTVIALIHFSASFRNGYLAFYINSSVNPIKVKDDGNRDVKIKGLRVPIDKGDKAMRKDSVVAGGENRDMDGKCKSKQAKWSKKIEKEKVISGAKIEFASVMEKREFLDMVKEMQRNMIELPDLLGVN